MTEADHGPSSSEAPAPPSRIVLELERSQAPLRGRVHSAHRDVAPFTGWIGLLTALETAIADAVSEPQKSWCDHDDSREQPL